MKRPDYFRPSRAVQRDRRWPALRLAARRRDEYQCVKCGSRYRIQVDHIRPVRDAPEVAFDLDNLQCLCAICHSRKTAEETGIRKPNPKRNAWLRACDELSQKSIVK